MKKSPSKSDSKKITLKKAPVAGAKEYSFFHHAKPAVPAQRVVNRNGMLTGKHHFSTPTLMEELLQKEKVVVKNDTVVEFEKLFWDPAKNLSL